MSREKAADVYLQCVTEAQSAAVFRMLLQLVHQGQEQTLRQCREGIQWLSVNTQVRLLRGRPPPPPD